MIETKYQGKKGEYLTVMEATKLGWPHMHVLTTRTWIDQAWLSNLWKTLTGAFIVDIRRVTNQGHAAAYVSKYLGKAPHRFLHCKRYYFTRGYIQRSEPAPKIFDWTGATHETLNGNVETMMVALQQSGLTLLEARDGYYVFEHPPPSCVFPAPGALAAA